MLLWFVFCVSAIVPKMLRMLVFFFPNFLGFLGWLLLVYLCLEGLGVFVFLVFGFLFGVGFVSVCLLCFVLWLDVVVSVSAFFVFFLCFLLFCFCFFGGFKGQVRWPEGPPHLALNPPYFLFFFYSSLPCLSLFLIGKPVFPPKKDNFWWFICVSLCFSLALFGPPLFSLSLSLSLFCSFFFLLPSCFSFLFLVLALSFCFVFVSRCYFVFVFSACCLALFWIIMFDFLLFCILFSYSCCFLVFLLLSYVFLWFSLPIKNISEKWKLQKKQKWKMHKRTFWQEQLAQVCSQIVSVFLFCDSLNFAFVLKTL